MAILSDPRITVFAFAIINAQLMCFIYLFLFFSFIGQAVPGRAKSNGHDRVAIAESSEHQSSSLSFLPSTAELTNSRRFRPIAEHRIAAAGCFAPTVWLESLSAASLRQPRLARRSRSPGRGRRRGVAASDGEQWGAPAPTRRRAISSSSSVSSSRRSRPLTLTCSPTFLTPISPPWLGFLASRHRITTWLR